MELRGANALVTGAAGGLGGYIARSLAAAGANVVLSDMPGAELEGLADELRGRGVKVGAVPADLRDREGRAGLIPAAEEAIGPLDVLVNNAGIEFGGPFDVQTPEELEAITTVNLVAVMELTLFAIRGMRERRRGHVVNIASVAGKTGTPFIASYAATKHAVVGFTHSLRAEYADEPLGFSAICPVYVSRVGMYGRLEGEVPEPPRFLRPVPPEQVGEAVVKAVRDDRAEITVTGTPLRPLFGLYAIAPKLVMWLISRRANREFSEAFARARGRM